ncbi:hypothetical protein Hanom_Chr05g00468151 [Helianthus anomalus]
MANVFTRFCFCVMAAILSLQLCGKLHVSHQWRSLRFSTVGGSKTYIPKKFHRTRGSKMYAPKNFYTKTTYITLLSEKFGRSGAYMCVYVFVSFDDFLHTKKNIWVK